MFNTPGYYNILIKGQYKMPNSNDGSMQLQAPTTCPKWNEGTDENVNPPMAQHTHWPHLWVRLRGNWTICQTTSGKHHEWYNMKWGCKVCSHKAGNVTASTSCQSSGTKCCIIKQCVWAIHISWQVNWSWSSVNLHWWWHDHWQASKTCSWPEQAPRQCRCHGQQINILIHPPIASNGTWGLLLVGEGVRYSISYLVYMLYINIYCYIKYIVMFNIFLLV